MSRARRLGFVALVTFAALTAAQRAHASGREFSLRGHDLLIDVDTRWAGGRLGGYLPVRMRIVNRASERTITVRFVSSNRGSGGNPTVSRTLRLEQNSTVQLSMPIPLTASENSGELLFLENGRGLEGLRGSVALPDFEHSAFDTPAVLIISSERVNSDQLVELLKARRQAAVNSGGGYYYGSSEPDVSSIPPIALPDAWIDYAAVDVLAIPRDVFADLPAEQRAAMLAWVRCGGTLLLYGVGENAAGSQDLARLLQFDRSSETGGGWKDCDAAIRQLVVKQAPPGGSAEAQNFAPNVVWQPAGTFSHRGMGFGKVFAFRESPFPGSVHDWDWFLRSLGPEQYDWSKRHGFVPRLGSDDLLDFLIPGVHGVPLIPFMVMITAFTVVIGPLNYFLLRRRKQLYLLTLTIPAVALATSGALFAYSAAAHGFGIKSRVRSLTCLDQGTNSAVSMSRVALFAGLAPSGGLRFSPETAVYPLRAPNSTSASSVDWTETQVLESGWIPSRTRTQFLTLAHRTERGRLQVEPAGSGRLKVSNGLEWDIESLLVTDDQRRVYSGGRLPAGAATELNPAPAEALGDFATLLQQQPLGKPNELAGNAYSYNVFGGLTPDDNPYIANQGLFSGSQDNLMERRLRDLQASLDRREQALERRSYIAVFSENPGIELGVEQTTQLAGYHVLWGSY